MKLFNNMLLLFIYCGIIFRRRCLYDVIVHLQRVEELENEVRRLRKELEGEKVRIARQAPSFLLMVSEPKPTNIFQI